MIKWDDLIDKVVEMGKSDREKEERVIAEQYHGDRDAYEADELEKIEAKWEQNSIKHAAEFNLETAARSLKMATYEIEDILRAKLPADSPRLIVFDQNRKCKRVSDKNYPGGYKAFLEDVENGYFR